MRYIYLSILFLFLTKSFPQFDSKIRFSLSIDGVYSTPFGNNFLNKCYKPNFGHAFETQINFQKIFFGIGSKTSNYSIVNKEIIGNFKNADLEVGYLFIGYRHYLKNKKFFFEDRIGYGNNVLINYSSISNYSISGNSFFLGTKANYSLHPKFNFYLGFELITENYDTITEELFKNFYQKSYQFEPKFGFKYLWGKTTKQL